MSPIISRANIGKVLLLVTAVSALAVGWWLRSVLADQPGSAGADADLNACQDRAQEFDAYPLLYLGDTFQGLPLNFCDRRQDPGTDYGIPSSDRFVFVYGDCEIEPGASSCPAPLQVTVFPRCDPPFEDAISRTEVIRGVSAHVLDAGVLVSTPLYKVLVSTGTRSAAAQKQALDAVAELRGANALAANLTHESSLGDGALFSAPASDSDPCNNQAPQVPATPTSGSVRAD